jgi:hypothetical protein
VHVQQQGVYNNFVHGAPGVPPLLIRPQGPFVPHKKKVLEVLPGSLDARPAERCQAFDISLETIVASIVITRWHGPRSTYVEKQENS